MAFRDYSTTPASNTALSDGTYVGPNMLRNKVRPAIQQMMADGKELADSVDAIDTANFQGDPGANVMAIGLKTAASGMTIDTGTNVIRTSGYSVTDVGAAFYVAVPTIDLFRPGTPVSPALTVIKGMRRTDDLVAGMTVSGEGIPSGATISTIDSASQITLSAAATTAPTKILRFHARAVNASLAALYPESIILSANARYFILSRGQTITPDMLSAAGDGATDDYAAYLAFTWFVSNMGGGCVALTPRKTYYIGQYQTAANSIAQLRIQGTVGLTFNGNGAKLDFAGNFDRAASTTSGIGLRFDNCSQLRLSNLEGDGNVEQTTNTSGSVENNSAVGLRFGACEDFIVENVHFHHFATDGGKVDVDSETYTIYTSGASFNRRASKRGEYRHCQFRFNARQGFTVGSAENILFYDCHFTDQARFTGTYGVGGNLGHAPKSGFDFEPNDNKSVADDLDVDPNNIHFRYCRFKNNQSGDWKATKSYTHTLSFEHCRVETPSDGTATSAVVIGIPNTVVRNNYLDMTRSRFELGGGTTTTFLIENNEIRSSGTSEIGLYSVNNSGRAILRNNRIIGTAVAPAAAANLISMTNTGVTFRDNYVFVPKEGYVDAGGSDDDTVVGLSGIKFACGNEYVTDLLAAAGSSGLGHYVVNHGTTEAFDEKFTGVAAGTADTIRPAVASTFNTTYKYSRNRPGYLGVPAKLAATDAALTYQHGRDGNHIELNVPITANRVVTLSATDATEDAEVAVTRTAAATGAFNWTVSGKALNAASQWARFRYSGGAWTLIAYGAL